MEIRADDEVFPLLIQRPSFSGPGSSREAWRSYAYHVEEANRGLQEVIQRQRDAIEALNAYVAHQEKAAAGRKPVGSRERLPAPKMARILEGLKAGHSMRSIAVQCGVSAMTVSRIAKKTKALEGGSTASA